MGQQNNMTNNKEPFLQTLYFLFRALIDFQKENNICIQEPVLLEFLLKNLGSHNLYLKWIVTTVMFICIFAIEYKRAMIRFQ